MAPLRQTISASFQTFAQCSILAIVALPIFVTAAHKLTLKGHKFCSVALKVFLLLILLGQFVFAIWMLVAEFGAALACSAKLLTACRIMLISPAQDLPELHVMQQNMRKRVISKTLYSSAQLLCLWYVYHFFRLCIQLKRASE